NLGGGFGLNASKSGLSASARSRAGSIGTRGFSIRSGIPGLSYRQSWGKNGTGMAIIAAVVGMVVYAVVYVVVNVLFLIVPLVWQCLAWIFMTTYDLCV